MNRSLKDNKRKLSDSSQLLNETFCFTDHFCYKLFCRSISNFKYNILLRKNANSLSILKTVLINGKEDDDSHTKSIIEKLLPHTWKICLNIKENFIKHSKDNFQDFFCDLKAKQSNVLHVDKREVLKIIIVIFNKVIPKDFYGVSKNCKAFYSLVSFIINGMAGQHIRYKKIINRWNIKSVEWLKTIDSDYDKMCVLIKFLIFILKNILCSILSLTFYITTTRFTHEIRKLYFYFKPHWQKISDKFISMLIKNGTIIKCNEYGIGRKSLVNKKKENRMFIKNLPIMRLMLKPDLSFRVIIRYKRQTFAEKRFDKYKRYFFKMITPHIKLKKIDESYKKLHTRWIENGKPKLYFVKMDLKDAFGAVDISTLQSLIRQLHLKFQKGENKLECKKMVCKEYQKIIEDLKKPILIRLGSCVYQWKKGLVQGMRFSPVLCEIFYSDADSNSLLEFCNNLNDINYLIRIVDDYLFISDNLYIAEKFMNHMIEQGKINHKKTIVNFKTENIQYSDEISFCGYLFNTNNMEVSRDETVYNGSICYRILFNHAISNIENFVAQRIGQTTVPLYPLFFDLQINSETTLWKNIFVTLCISANKFCTILSIIYCSSDEYDSDHILKIYKEKIAVRMCDFMLKIIKNCTLKTIEFKYCINHFRYISYKALSLFASSNNICQKLIPSINIHLKKTNCMTGKWKEHFQSIDKSGIIESMAKKEICQCLNIKKNIQQFNKIPSGMSLFTIL